MGRVEPEWKCFSLKLSSAGFVFHFHLLSWQMQNYLYLLLKNVVWNSGRELFLADASLFVDDAEAFDHYEREEEEIPNSQLSRPPEEV